MISCTTTSYGICKVYGSRFKRFKVHPSSEAGLTAGEEGSKFRVHGSKGFFLPLAAGF
jgi:hypothetical protein